MRDLSTLELGFVYGAGAGCSPTPPSRAPKCNKGTRGKNTGKYGKGTGSRGKKSGGKGSGGRCGR